MMWAPRTMLLLAVVVVAGAPREEDAALRIVDVAVPSALNVEWRRPGLLVIRYDYGWIQRYTNLRTVVDGKDRRYLVEIRLISPTGDDSALPARYRF